MSCRVWGELAGAGDRLLLEGSAERVRAEEHFASCPSCARRAFLLDPSWAVRRMPSTEIDEGELIALGKRVAGAERVRDVETAERARRGRIAAAAASVALVIAMSAGLATRDAALESTGSIQASAPASVVPGPASPVELSVPAVGTLSPAAARVYDLGQEDFALVMVVHETLDL